MGAFSVVVSLCEQGIHMYASSAQKRAAMFKEHFCIVLSIMKKIVPPLNTHKRSAVNCALYGFQTDYSRISA